MPTDPAQFWLTAIASLFETTGLWVRLNASYVLSARRHVFKMNKQAVPCVEQEHLNGTLTAQDQMHYT